MPDSATSPLALRFVLSSPTVAGLPWSPAEVAVMGRSNVGKSSLINALSHRRDLAKVSRTPGRTRLLNLFEVGATTGGGTVVDLPGYGYAAVSRATQAGWPKMIADYLTERPQLRRVLVLVDGEIGPTSLDVDMLGWVGGLGVPLSVVATKQDKVRSQQRLRRQRELAAACELPAAEVAWVSAARGTGIDRLRASVNAWLALR